MKHLKRYNVPKIWGSKRKGTKYLVKPNSNLKTGIPILFILRDMLNLAQTRKEVKKAIHMKNLLLNQRLIRDEKNVALLFDVITVIPAKKSYKLTLSENKKYKLEEVKDKEAETKISKIINKKILKGKKVQLNLSDGRNYLSDEKVSMGDSAVINLKNNKIEGIIKLKEGSKVLVFAGKHTGKIGEIKKIKTERKIAKLKTEKEEINVLIKQMIAIK